MMFRSEKYTGVIFHDTGQWCKIWKTLTLWFQKWHEELGELSSSDHPTVWKLYIEGLFLSKAYTASAENFRGIICHDTEGCLNENWLDWVEKWHKQFGQFSFEQLSVPKFALWFDLLGQSIQIFRWKSTEELLMTLKSDAKFEEKLILCSKNDMRNLGNFNLSSGKDLKCVLWWATFVESI